MDQDRKPLIIKITSDRLLIRKRLELHHDETGPRLLEYGGVMLDRDGRVEVEATGYHCDSCGVSIADMAGLNRRQVEALKNWRDRKRLGYTSQELGEALDMVVKILDTQDETCTEPDLFPIMVEVTE